MDVNRKTALVTGSAQRLGRAAALELGRRGARVAIHHRAENSKADALETLRLVREAGGDGETFQAELTDLWQLDDMFEAIRAEFGGLHILINNASVFSP